MNSIDPRKRDLHFTLDAEQIATWFGKSAHLSHFLNTMSLFFPAGERFFIESVRAHAKGLPENLVAPVQGFIAQEALHGREHDQYNQIFLEHFPAARKAERKVAKILRTAQQRLPLKAQLSTTIALEHLTAIMAEGLLSDPRLAADMDPTYRDLWLWHALEETEHKAVAFDVWGHTFGRGLRTYLRRCIGLATATSMFALLAAPIFLRALARDGKLGDWAGWKLLFKYMLGEYGFVRKLIGPWLSYFRPSFHPWDHDNRERLGLLDTLSKRYERASRSALRQLKLAS